MGIHLVPVPQDFDAHMVNVSQRNEENVPHFFQPMLTAMLTLISTLKLTLCSSRMSRGKNGNSHDNTRKVFRVSQLISHFVFNRSDKSKDTVRRENSCTLSFILFSKFMLRLTDIN